IALALKKIVHIISGLKSGGAERSLFNVCNSNISDYFKQSVICLGDKAIYGDKLEELGVEVYYLNFKNSNKLYAFLNFKNIIKKISPDIVQGWMTHGNFASVLAYFILSGRPSLFWNIRQTVYKLKHEYILTRFLFLINILLSRLPNGIISNANISIKQLIKFGYKNDSFILIPNGFDTNYWKPDHNLRQIERNKLKFNENDFVLGYVGRYHPMKNIKLLLESFHKLSQQNSKVKLVIVGQNLNNYNINEKSIIDMIPLNQILIIDNTEDVKKYYNIFDLLILCSAWGEGFPNVLGEAMSSELCCISTPVGDTPDILEDVGYLVPLDDVDLIIEKVKNCMDNPEELNKLGRKARIKILNQYSMEKTINSYLNIYLNSLK
ncbi:MAG: glycosyltransferase, partial [Saprospiraceae bacterium]|nr:glycosyltransferase [Saprospiraceae bacterium]